MAAPNRTHAVVIGGSVTGLLAARVLADFYQRVTVLDRDALPQDPEPRKGVPQGNQIHVLLIGGANVIEALFPGFFQQIVREGSVPVDFSTPDASWFQHGVWKAKASRRLVVHSQTRPFLEGHLRSRVHALKNVSVLTQTVANRLAFDDSRTRVTGVGARAAADESDPGRLIEADLVVDASGRNSSTPKQLEDAGYPRPRETTVGIKMGYSTRFYAAPPDAPAHLKALAVYSKPPKTRKSGLAMRVEGNRWHVTLSGALGDYPPTDDAGFLEFARQLDDPAIHDWLVRARPLSSAVPYRYPAHLRRHYSGLSRFPEGLLVCGDALCSFNPIYGQGMTAGALEVLALQNTLKSHAERSTPLWRAYFPAADRAVHGPWSMATGADFLYPETEGDRPWDIRFRNWYLHRLLAATGRHPDVTATFYEVLHVLRKPSALFSPAILAKVLAG